MRRMFTLFLTCSIVFPKVEFACSSARSASKSVFILTLGGTKINPGLQPGTLDERKDSMNFDEDETLFNVILQVAVMGHVVGFAV